jgi:hypothetical protein
MMRFYHRTTKKNAEAILASGFRDGVGNYLAQHIWSGVWLSDVPLDVNEGADGDTLLEVTVDLGKDVLDGYEWVEEGKGYREWLVPADVLNPKMTVRLVSEEEEFGEA